MGLKPQLLKYMSGRTARASAHVTIIASRGSKGDLSTHQDDRNGAGCLCAHDKRLLDVGRLAGPADECSEAVVGHLYPLIGLMHVVNQLVSVEKDNQINRDKAHRNLLHPLS